MRNGGLMIRRAVLMLAVPILVSAGRADAACSGTDLVWSCAAGTSIAELNSARAAAPDGATVTFAAGSYTWTSGSIYLSNAKGVTLACATPRACTVAQGANNLVYMDSLSGENTNLYRVTGFVFSGASA